MMIGGELSTYAISGDQLVRTGATTLTDAVDSPGVPVLQIGEGGWADRDHLFLSIGDRDVVLVTASAVSRVEVPPESAFATPRPSSPDSSELRRGNEVARTSSGLVVTDGAATWSECPWGLPYDGFQCSGWVHARLWPTPALATNQPALDGRSWSWPRTAPAKMAATVGRTAVTCSGGSVKTTMAADSSEEIGGAHWVSIKPPRLLVIYGRHGYMDLVPDRWTLHAGCGTVPIARGTSATPGPAGLWLAYETDDYRGKSKLYRGATVIGEIPPHANVMLRPPR